jgi:hypothetical protein
MVAVLRVLVLANALLLALPPGWCCLPADEPARAAAPCRGCCHQAGDPQDATPEPEPLPPANDCCCLWDSVPPPDSRGLAPDLSVAAAVFAEALPVLHAPRVEREAPHSFAPPPRHVLLCLWLC